MKLRFIIFIPVLIVFKLSAQIATPKIPFYQQRERTFDVQHIKIEVSFDEENKKVFGKVTSKVVPLHNNFKIIELDAEDMIFQSAHVNGSNAEIDTSIEKKIRLILHQTYSTRDTLTYSIDYVSAPRKGLYFIAKDSTDPDSPRQIWTQGESQDNHHWFPCYDTPNDKSTSEIIMTVKSDYLTVSNGRLISRKDEQKKKLTTWHWLQDKPHSSYLIVLVAGDYKRIEERYKDKVVDFYAYKSNIDDARNSLNHTVDAIEFFSDKIGYDYPWDKYSQVILRNFMYGGMENTSVTTLTETTIHDRRSEIDGVSSVGVMAHELAHQWWGDLVTTQSWSHIWLNEGFATYFEALFTEHILGRESFEFEMMNNAFAVKRFNESNRTAVIFQQGTDVDEWPISNVYQKGSCVLNMLRWLLGDDVWWKAMNVYAHRYAFRNVDTDDVRKVFEEVSGKDLRTFFNQWLYDAGHPSYKVHYSWDQDRRVIELRVQQTQKVDSLTGLFSMPVDIALWTASGRKIQRIDITKADETFTLSCDTDPALVEFDAPGVLLKEIDFPKSIASFIYQLKNGSSIESKKMAMDSLAKFPNDKMISNALKDCALNDPFFKLRQHAILYLKKYKEEITSEDFKTFIKDNNAQVRDDAIDLMQCENKIECMNALLRIIHTDSSYNCNSTALKKLAAIDSARAFEESISLLRANNQAPTLKASALIVLMQLKEKQSIPIVVQFTKSTERFDVRYSAVQLIAKLGANENSVSQALIESLKDKSIIIRNTSARTLGESNHEGALEALNAALRIEKSAIVKSTLQRAIEKLETGSTKK